jgi:hypothetical protein
VALSGSVPSGVRYSLRPHRDVDVSVSHYWTPAGPVPFRHLTLAASGRYLVSCSVALRLTFVNPLPLNLIQDIEKLDPLVFKTFGVIDNNIYLSISLLLSNAARISAKDPPGKFI